MRQETLHSSDSHHGQVDLSLHHLSATRAFLLFHEVLPEFLTSLSATTPTLQWQTNRHNSSKSTPQKTLLLSSQTPPLRTRISMPSSSSRTPWCQHVRIALASFVYTCSRVLFLVIGATGACLVGGFVAYRNGNQRLSQLMQRGRVFFQGMTILALVVGTWNMGSKNAGQQR